MFKRTTKSNVKRPQDVIRTLVPGGDDVELIAFYPDFLSYYPECELQTKRFFQERVRPDWICIDAGANVGYHSILLGRLAHLGQVYAFEPTITYEMLIKNLAWNGASNVAAIRMGLSSRSFNGTLPLYRVWGQEAEPTQARFTSIDDFVFEQGLKRLDLIKIDVDGFDLEVLWGAKNTLEKFSPLVVVELNHALTTRGHTPSEAMSFMLENRYSTALVLDSDNYAFQKTWQIGQPWPRSLNVEFDQRDPKHGHHLIPGREIFADITSNRHLHERAQYQDDFTAVLDAPAWNYAMSFELPSDLQPLSAVCIQVEVKSGRLGLFLSDEHGSRILSGVVVIGESITKTVVLPTDPTESRQLIVRKTTDEPLVFRIHRVELRDYHQESPPLGILNAASVRSLAAAVHCELLGSWESTPLGRVADVDTQFLAQRLRIEPYLSSPWGRSLEDAVDYLMERGDAPILDWLYRNIRPRLHFEFGTWEGFGATLCLRACDARVWTINLPLGESIGESMAYVNSRLPWHPDNPIQQTDGSSDSAESIGWMYRSAGFSQRVTQLLGDSKDLEGLEVPFGAFETVLIDGSHERERVRSDQRNALRLIDRRGVILWHDFSLLPNVLRDQTSCRGVVAAVADDIELLSANLDLYWIRDTLLLVGVSRDVVSAYRGDSAAVSS